MKKPYIKPSLKPGRVMPEPMLDVVSGGGDKGVYKGEGQLSRQHSRWEWDEEEE